MLSLCIAFLVRLLLVALFMPLSALDKLLEFDTAVDQTGESFASRNVATAMIVAGPCVEVFKSLGALTGI